MKQTRREQINQLLQDSVLLSEIFDSTHDGIMVVGEDGIIAYTNLAAERLLGISNDHLIGIKAEELPLSMHDRSGTEVLQKNKPFAEAFSEGKIKGPTQVILKRPDGSTLPVLFNVRRKGNGITVAVLTDHSEMMRRQQQADDYYKLLAHDMRTPLTVILGHANILHSNIEREKNTSLKAIMDAGKQLESMTEEMSDRLELESGHFRLKKEEIQLEELVHDIVSQLSSAQLSSAQLKHNIHIETGDDALSTVKADNHRLKRVLINLITNAKKYSPAGSNIIISLWENAKGLMVKVSDQGRGIETEDLNYIFDPFFITNVGKEQGGTGLGLYISRLIIEAHNGRIYVSSTEEGSSFVLFLPKA